MNTDHGHFHWNELMTAKAEDAMAFYGATLGWTFDAFPMEAGTYHVCMSNGQPVGGIMPVTEGDDWGAMAERWFAYIAVDDIEARLEGVAAAGGEIARPVFHVPGVGRIAIVQDAIDSLVGWITPEPPQG